MALFAPTKTMLRIEPVLHILHLLYRLEMHVRQCDLASEKIKTDFFIQLHLYINVWLDIVALETRKTYFFTTASYTISLRIYSTSSFHKSVKLSL